MPVCRFFSTAFGLKSSHFYTPFAPECAIVKQNPNWQFEAAVFAVVLPDADGNCPSGTAPLYRLYNNGMGGAPNHRYTTDPSVFNTMRALGWMPEGAGVGSDRLRAPVAAASACVPRVADLPRQVEQRPATWRALRLFVVRRRPS